MRLCRIGRRPGVPQAAGRRRKNAPKDAAKREIQQAAVRAGEMRAAVRLHALRGAGSRALEEMRLHYV